MELKFFHIVELNLEHKLLTDVRALQEYQNLSWLTLTSKPIAGDKEAMEQCMDFMQAKLKDFEDDGHKVKLHYSENPLLGTDPTDADFDALDVECDFDESTLIYASIEDKFGSIIRSSVMVYGVDKSPRKGTH